MPKSEERIAFRYRMAELEEKLRKSEAERLELEEKFSVMMRSCREEEESRLSVLRAKYEKCLEMEKRRRDRNQQIMQTLERIENRSLMITAKSERLQLLKKHYEAYLASMYPQWNTGNIKTHEMQDAKLCQRHPEPRKESYDHSSVKGHNGHSLFPLNPVKGSYISPRTPVEPPYLIPNVYVEPDTLLHSPTPAPQVLQTSDTLPSHTNQNYSSLPVLSYSSTPKEVAVIPRIIPRATAEELTHKNYLSEFDDEVSKRSNEFRRRNLFADEPYEHLDQSYGVPLTNNVNPQNETNIRLTEYIDTAAKLLNYKRPSKVTKDVENEIKETNSMDYEMEQNTSGDLLQMSLSDDGLLLEPADPDIPASDLFLPRRSFSPSGNIRHPEVLTGDQGSLKVSGDDYVGTNTNMPADRPLQRKQHSENTSFVKPRQSLPFGEVNERELREKDKFNKKRNDRDVIQEQEDSVVMAAQSRSVESLGESVQGISNEFDQQQQKQLVNKSQEILIEEDKRGYGIVGENGMEANRDEDQAYSDSNQIEFVEGNAEYVEEKEKYIEGQRVSIPEQEEYTVEGQEKYGEDFKKGQEEGQYVEGEQIYPTEGQEEFVEGRGQYFEEQEGYTAEGQGDDTVEIQGEYVDAQGQYVNGQEGYVEGQGEYVEEQEGYTDGGQTNYTVERQGEYVDGQGQYVDRQEEYVEGQGEYVEGQGEYVEGQEGYTAEGQGDYTVERQGEYVDEQDVYVEGQGEYGVDDQVAYMTEGRGEYVAEQVQYGDGQDEYAMEDQAGYREGQEQYVGDEQGVEYAIEGQGQYAEGGQGGYVDDQQEYADRTDHYEGEPAQYEVDAGAGYGVQGEYGVEDRSAYEQPEYEAQNQPEYTGYESQQDYTAGGQHAAQGDLQGEYQESQQTYGGYKGTDVQETYEGEEQYSNQYDPQNQGEFESYVEQSEQNPDQFEQESIQEGDVTYQQEFPKDIQQLEDDDSRDGKYHEPTVAYEPGKGSHLKEGSSRDEEPSYSNSQEQLAVQSNSPSGKSGKVIKKPQQTSNVAESLAKQGAVPAPKKMGLAMLESDTESSLQLENASISNDDSDFDFSSENR